MQATLTNTPPDSNEESWSVDHRAEALQFDLIKRVIAGEAITYRIGETTCLVCKERFAYRAPEQDRTQPSRCAACEEKAEQEALAQEREQARFQRIERARERVPPLYRENDVSRFPAVWEKVQAWTPNDGGFGLVGPTGVCKTRMVYERLVSTEEAWLALTGFRLQLAAQQKWSDPDSKRLIEQARKVPVLFIDDLGKQRFSESGEAEIFDLIEERVSHARPIIFTSNLVGDDLERMMSENVAVPLLRRLREFCQIIVFNRA